jgi:hypothetical protein
MQRNNSPIGELIPALLMLFEDLKELKINGIAVTGKCAILKDLLVKSFQKKFKRVVIKSLFSFIFVIS